MEQEQKQNDKNSENKGTFNYWFLTWNNPGDNWQEKLESLKPTWAKGQLEKGENGTPHIQALLYFSSKCRTSHFKNIPVWVSGLKKSDAQTKVQAYCTKQDTRLEGPIEIGISPFKEIRNWRRIREAAEQGSWEDIDDETYVRLYGNLKKIHGDQQHLVAINTGGVYWIVGPSGCGKSYMAHEIAGKDLFKKNGASKWWDGYKGQSTVVFEDIDKSANSHAYDYKLWLDVYPLSVEVKGSMVGLKHSRSIVTSNYSPEEVFSDPIVAGAIRRRCIFIVPRKAQLYNPKLKYTFICLI